MPRLRPTTRPRDVLIRRPWLEASPRRRSPAAIDVIEQLEELAALLQRGMLSREEFERHKRKVLSS